MHLCCALSDSIKSFKVLISNIFSVAQARSSLGRSFHKFAAAYSNIMLKYACALVLTTEAYTFPSILIKFLILILQFIFIFQFVTYSPLSYDEYKYPDWGQAVGWLLTLSSLSLIPAVMIYKLINTTGTIKEVLNISRSGLNFKF